jgi:hypothetical protein
MSVLKLFTDDEANVFAASVYYHLSGYIPVTLIGLYYFNTTGLTLAEVEAGAAAGLDGALPGERTSVGSTPPRSLASTSSPADSVTSAE